MAKKFTKEQVKKAALEFLQVGALQLRKDVANLVDAQFENGKIVLTVRGELKDAPVLSHDGVTFSVSVKEADDELPKVTPSAAEDKAKEILRKYPTVHNAEVYEHKMKEAISHQGAPTVQDPEAYKAWKVRHKNVKTGE